MQEEPFLLFFFSNLLMRRGRKGVLPLIAAVTPPLPSIKRRGAQSGGARQGEGECLQGGPAQTGTHIVFSQAAGGPRGRGRAGSSQGGRGQPRAPLQESFRRLE